MKNFCCEICCLEFARISLLERHFRCGRHILKTHQNLVDENQNLVDENKNLRYENQNLILKNEQLQSKLQSVVINNNNSIHNNLTVNVNLRAYGKENWQSLPEDVILKLMKRVSSSIPEIIKNLHFNASMPENHNIRIPNQKFSRVQVFDGSQWVTKVKSAVLEDLIEKALDKCDDVEDKFKLVSSSFISSLWDDYSRSLRGEKIDKDSKRQKKDIFQKIECCILDNQNCLIKSKE
jgi:hypothetical protein